MSKADMRGPHVKGQKGHYELLLAVVGPKGNRSGM